MRFAGGQDRRGGTPAGCSPHGDGRVPQGNSAEGRRAMFLERLSKWLLIVATLFLLGGALYWAYFA